MTGEQEARIQWENEVLRDFISSCPARLMIYGYPSRSCFFTLFSPDSREAFLAREAGQPSDINGLRQLSQSDWEQMAGFDDSDSSQQFIAEFDQIQMKIQNGIFQFLDQKSRYFTFQNGRRLMGCEHGTNPGTVFVIGACNVLGLFCKAEKTIPYVLKEALLRRGHDVSVWNCGIWGSENILSTLYRYGYQAEDTVVLILTGFQADRLKEIAEPYYFGDFSAPIAALPPAQLYLWNNIAHHGVEINRVIAETIADDIGRQTTHRPFKKALMPRDYYLPWSVFDYYHKLAQRFSRKNDTQRVGAIVMNANPFTLGHRYLVTEALKSVDLLYLFVVEEDRSAFSFSDRLRLVCEGTRDLDRVVVLGGGHYIISQITFPDYFEKEHIRETQDMSYDLLIFSDVVAPIFGISVRFVGTEPTDRVTRAYNEAMKKLLPERGILVREISRLHKNGTLISATEVRKLIRKGMVERIRPMVPDTTYRAIVSETVKMADP